MEADYAATDALEAASEVDSNASFGHSTSGGSSGEEDDVGCE